jgi:DNA-binding NarL/FixJ family response regulator
MYALSSPVPTLTHPISTLLVDDSVAFRHGLRNLLDFHNSTSPLQFQIVGQAATLRQALDLVLQQSPMLILLDMELAQDSGINLLQQLQAQTKRSHVLVVSGHQEEEWVFKAMQAGARGYIFKHQLSMQLLEAIQVVLQDRIYLPPEVATQFFQQFHFCAGRSLTKSSTVHLTEREQDVLRWLVQGASNEAISRHLNITVGTVKAYLTTIFEKLEVTSRTQAALQALKLGLISV